MRKIRLDLEKLGVESFETAAGSLARGTVRGNFGSEPEQPASDPDFPGGSGFNSCETCIFVTCGTCPDQQ